MSTSVSGVSGVIPISPASAIDAIRPAASAPVRPASDDPAAFFDMTGWQGAQGPTVSPGPARTGTADLAALSGVVLAAILR